MAFGLGKSCPWGILGVRIVGWASKGSAKACSEGDVSRKNEIMRSLGGQSQAQSVGVYFHLSPEPHLAPACPRQPITQLGLVFVGIQLVVTVLQGSIALQPAGRASHAVTLAGTGLPHAGGVRSALVSNHAGRVDQGAV